MRPLRMSANALAVAVRVPASRINDILLERCGGWAYATSTLTACASGQIRRSFVAMVMHCLQFRIRTPKL